VEVCEQKNLSHFIYGQFTYGNKHQSTLAEFKRRNGFEQIDFPRYFVPLSAKGRIFVGLQLYRGIHGLLPDWALHALWAARAWCYKALLINRAGKEQP